MGEERPTIGLVRTLAAAGTSWRNMPDATGACPHAIGFAALISCTEPVWAWNAHG